MKYRCALFAIILIFLCQIPSAGAAKPKRGMKVTERLTSLGSLYENSYAVIIGINNYKKWPALEYAIKDAKVMEEKLKALGFQTTLLVDQNATKDNILKVLGDELPQKVKKNDRVIIFFAGHGQTEELADGTQMGYIVPVDADTRNIYSTAISMGQVRDFSRRLAAKHVFYLIDSCYAGLGLTRSGTIPPSERDYLRKITTRKAHQMLTAGGKGEQAHEEGGHGVFTKYVLEALDGAADRDEKGYMTFSDIASYVKPKVSRQTEAKQVPQYGNIDGEGEFVFVTAKMENSSTDNVPIERKSFRSLVTGMEFVFVRGGCFQMGDLWGDGTEDEKPVHEVCVDDFYIGMHEVTMGQFKTFITETGYRTDGEKRGYGCTRVLINEWDYDPKAFWYSPGFAQSENHPVVCVSPDDAEAFAGWLTRKEGRIFRLPTEAEWEYVARSKGKNYKYSWGNSLPSGNIADESLKKVSPNWSIWDNYNDGYVFTAPVGQFKPNDLGLYDLTGNVWEFCSDYYDKNYYQKSPRNNPRALRTEYRKGFGQRQSVRGGAWSSPPQFVRVSSRAFFDPQPYINDDTGFRLLMLTK